MPNLPSGLKSFAGFLRRHVGAAILSGGFLLLAPGAVAAENDALFGVGQSGVIRPQTYTVFNAWTWSPLFGPPTIGSGYPQPIGHQHIPTGPNSYVYRPVTDLSMMLGLARQSIHEADYQAALLNLEPVLKVSPANGEAWMAESQALFGLGRYPEAATALHFSMRNLPREAWGEPVRNFSRYFRSSEEYTARLRALEAYVRANPAEAAGRYLLGYHYGYLGHATEAKRELEIAIKLVAAANAGNLVAPPAAAPSPAAQEPGPAPAREGPREF
ncbi:MAG TPA: hypothetical protein VGJ26_06195 [Pirellulales bacterium]|jgi:hypothetical protein